MVNFDIKKIKNELTEDDIFQLLEFLDAEPQIKENAIICRTICHGGNSHKLYYYPNSKLFHCFTDCGDSFDVMELVRRAKGYQQLYDAILFVSNFFHKTGYVLPQVNEIIQEDLEYIKNYDRIKNFSLVVQDVELEEYNGDFLNYLPRPIIQPWIDDGISKEVMDFYEICYNPAHHGIVIPHRDINGRLVGVRERHLIKENVEKYGKYLPLRIGGKMYNHPLSYNLYGLYQNQDNIKRFGRALVFESEKATLQYATMFGQENNVAVAICGSSFINYQCWLLIQQGVKEIVVCLDKQYKEIGDDEYKKLVRNLKNIHKKYGSLVTISFVFDKWKVLSYKASPTDEGIDKFMWLYKRREQIYD